MFRKSQSTVLAARAAAAFLSATPAFAINDDGRGGIYESLMDMVGMGEKSDPPPIAYRERSPLVVPPKTDLPAPRQSASRREAAWPTDQEIVRARKKDDTSARRKYLETNGGEIVSAEELRAGRTTQKPTGPVSGPGTGCSMDPFDKSSCSPQEYWGKLAVTAEKKEDAGVQAGVEVEREYLTQPPKGYMKATKNVKATFEPYKKDDEDPRSYYWDQAKKRSE